MTLRRVAQTDSPAAILSDPGDGLLAPTLRAHGGSLRGRWERSWLLPCPERGTVALRRFGVAD